MGMTSDCDFYGEERLLYHQYQMCSTSHSSFLSPFRKMKGLKKIKKRIGLVSKFKSNSGITNHPLPLKFHSNHGENITLKKDKTVAERSNSFCKGLTFTNRPVQIEEKIFVKLIEKSNQWSGVIRFGFTNVDPDTIKDLPKYACPDLTNKDGFWAKAVNEKYAEKDAVLCFYVSKSGVVHYGINGRSKEVFFSGVDTSNKLWALIDVYGNSTVVELINRQLNNMTPDQEAGFDLNNAKRHSTESNLYEEIDSGMDVLNLMDAPRISYSARESRPVPICLEEPSSSNYIGHKRCSQTVRAKPNHVKTQQTLKLDPLHFHEKHGTNVRLSNDRCIASRIESAMDLGYVFSSTSIKENEFLFVQILKVNSDYTGGLMFGIIATDPKNITQLPTDSDALIDVMDCYCITKKNIAAPLAEGDELIFSIAKNGTVKMKKNKDHQLDLFVIDNSIPLWWMFDIFGSTTKIRAYTGVLVDNNQPALSQGSSHWVPSQSSLMPVNSYTNSASHSSTLITHSVPHSSTLVTPQPFTNVPAVLVVKCCSSPDANCAMEPINIIFQNQPGATNEIDINIGSSEFQSSSHRVPSLPSTEYANVRPMKSRDIDVSMADNGRNREHHLHEWARTKSRGVTSNSNRLNECTVCYEKAVDAVLYNCGHMCMCFGCALELWKGRGDGHCPICRAAIKDVIRTYKS